MFLAKSANVLLVSGPKSLGNKAIEWTAARFVRGTKKQFFSGGIKEDHILVLIDGDNCVQRRVDYRGQLRFIPVQGFQNSAIVFHYLPTCTFGQLLPGHVHRNSLTSNRPSSIVANG